MNSIQKDLVEALKATGFDFSTIPPMPKSGESDYSSLPDDIYYTYSELLLSNHNLVLTGAPGTGKTWLAKAIAYKMNAETEFVQFHPSYDYTDFVEGLRPILPDDSSSQIGFERRDGLFKRFCKQAHRHNNTNANDALASFKLDLKEKESISIPYIDSDGCFGVSLSPDNRLVVDTKSENPNRQSATDDSVIKVIETGEKEGNQTYPYCVGVYIKKNYIKKPFVFIIDEINRGEVSKILGELFFAIDPGYRGIEGKVTTQYQGLITKKDDFFKEGFYIPNNVYILATMNDIDRSVESMDFAMRRRFTWVEIIPEETAYMLESLGDELASMAKKKMDNINEEISTTQGLGAAFMIGPAYFKKVKDFGGDFDRLWKLNIMPLLKEYLRGFKHAKETLDKFKEAYDKD